MRVLVVWEPVLATDLRAPSTLVLRRVHDERVQQFWDKDRLLSKAMGEKDRRTIVWDQIGIYDAEAQWEDSPPKPRFVDRPVVHVIDRAREALHSGVGTEPRASASGNVHPVY